MWLLVFHEAHTCYAHRCLKVDEDREGKLLFIRRIYSNVYFSENVHKEVEKKTAGVEENRGRGEEKTERGEEKKTELAFLRSKCL